MKAYDVVILGAGIIGVSLARALRHEGATVLLVERGEPGCEASQAAAGMLTPQGGDLPTALQNLADASAAMYPEFVRELEAESSLQVDLRSQGSILLLNNNEDAHASQLPSPTARPLLADELYALEPSLTVKSRAYFLQERSVDPRLLMEASLKAALQHGVGLVTGAEALAVTAIGNSRLRIRTATVDYSCTHAVNCCGAWAGNVKPLSFPTRVVKGQMLSVQAPHPEYLRHTVRAPEVYLVPRSDGRIVIGATVEEVGFDKHVEAAAIEKLHRAAMALMPELANARILECWAGLRPATADELPILSPTTLPGYFIATGHFRNGILLAPITAKVMTQLLRGQNPECDLSRFSVSRFSA